jgi:hypothetical protein
MGSMAKFADAGGGGTNYAGGGGIDFPAAGPATGVDQYDVAPGAGSGPSVETPTDPFAGSVGGTIPGTDSFAGSVGGTIPGGGPAGGGIISSPSGGVTFGGTGTGGYGLPGYGFLGTMAGFNASPEEIIRNIVAARAGRRGTRITTPIMPPYAMVLGRRGTVPAQTANPNLILANILAAARAGGGIGGGGRFLAPQ